MTEALAVRPVAPPLEFTPEQRKMILFSFLNGATEAEAAVLMELARIRRLNPITRQIHFVKRWDTERNGYVWSSQVGIDGFRAIAERTGLYDGQDEPEFTYDKDGKLFSCKVKVYRKDWGRPAVGIAHFSEYAQYKKDKSLTRMWFEKPHVMLAKCAEAGAFRKGFPEDTSGLYTPEEMPEVAERDVTPAPLASKPGGLLEVVAPANLETTSAQRAPVTAAAAPAAAAGPDWAPNGAPVSERARQEVALAAIAEHTELKKWAANVEELLKAGKLTKADKNEMRPLFNKRLGELSAAGRAA